MASTSSAVMSPRTRARRGITEPAYQRPALARHLAPEGNRPSLVRSAIARQPLLEVPTTPPFRTGELLVPGFLAIVLGIAAFARGPRFFDDAYITFRYARNFAEGAGFVYNPGERVLGTSAPLFGFLLAAGRVLTGTAIPRLALLTAAACLAALSLLGYRLARRVASPLFSALFVLAALAPRDTLRIFASGMETPVYLLGILGAVELACRGRDAMAFCVASGLFFIHPDGIALAPCLALAQRFARGRWALGAAGRGMIPAALLALLLTGTYGSPVPNSVTAKRRAYSMPAGHAAGELSESVFDAVAAPELRCRSGAAAGVPVEAAAALVLAALAGITLWKGRAAFAHTAALSIAFFGGAYFCVFAAANPLVFDWYRPPLVLSVAFVMAACASCLRRVGRVLAASLLAATAAFHLATFAPYDTSGREDVYRRAAEALAPSPADVVTAPEIGALGWFSRARILDASGLVSREAVPFLAARLGSGGPIPPGLVKALRPAHVVSLRSFLDPMLAKEPRALEGYALVARYPAAAFGREDEVVVYSRTP